MAIKTDKFIGNKIESTDGSFTIDIKDLGTGDLSAAVVNGDFNTAEKTLTLTKGDNSTIEINLSSIAGDTDTNTYITGVELEGTSIKITRSDGQEFSVDLTSIDTKDAQSIKGKQIDALPAEPLVLLFNPNSNKFEFTDMPTCEQGNIIVPTYTRVETGLTEADVEQIITNRIASLKINESRGYEPVRYICLEPNEVVPINKGVVEWMKTVGRGEGGVSEIIDDRFITTNGELIFAGYNNSKIKVLDFDGNIVSTHDVVDENGGAIYIGDINSVTKNGKRIFAKSAIYDLQDDGNYKKVAQEEFRSDNTKGSAFLCNSCGNKAINFTGSIYIKKLGEAGTWDTIKEIEDKNYQNLNLAGYGFKKGVYRVNDRDFTVFEFDDEYNITDLTTISLYGYETSGVINTVGISQDGKIVGAGLNNYTFLFVYNEETEEYELSAKIKGENGTEGMEDAVLFNNRGDRFVGVSWGKLHFFKINMKPTMYCGSEKTYTIDETLDLAQGDIALSNINSFCRDKRGANNSNARTLFINDDEENTGDIFFVDVENDTKQLVLNAGSNAKYMISGGNYLLLQLDDDTLKYYNVEDLDNPIEITLPDFSNYTKINIQNCTIFSGDLAISVEDNNNKYLDYYTLDTTDNSLTKDTDKSYTGAAALQRDWENSKNIEVQIINNNDIDTGDYLNTTIEISDTLGNSSTLEVDLGKDAKQSFKIIGNLLVLAAENKDDNQDTVSYDLIFMCIEDINNIKLVEQAEEASSADLKIEQLFGLYNDYNKAQKTIFKYKNSSEIEVFSLLF